MVTALTTALELLHLLSCCAETRSLSLSLSLFLTVGLQIFSVSSFTLMTSGPSCVGCWALNLLFWHFFVVSEFDQTWICTL